MKLKFEEDSIEDEMEEQVFFYEGFQKSELLIVSEEIYNIKCKIDDLQLKIADDEFHARYIPKKKENALGQSSTRIFLIIILSVVNLVALFVLIISAREASEAPILGLVIMFCLGLLICCGILEFKFVIAQMDVSKRLHYSLDKDRAIQYSKDKDVNTYQSDQIKTEERLKDLREQVAKLQKQKDELEIKQAELIQQKEKRESVLEEMGIIVSAKSQNNSLSLVDPDLVQDDLIELDQFYASEINLLENYIQRMQTKLKSYEAELMNVEERFAIVKQKILIAFILFVALIFMQSVFKDTAASLSAIICIFLCLGGIYYLDRTCSVDVVRYLIEHDHELTKEYVFRNCITPTFERRLKLLEVLENSEKELKELKEKREKLEV